MSNSTRRYSFRRVLLDMNTQYDYLLPRGALPVANRTEALANLHRIMNWARVEDLPIISSLQCQRIGEATDGLPPHCVDHSTGQKKLPFTLLPRRIVLHGDNTLDLPLDPFRRFQQIIFTKRKGDFLSNPKADRLMNTIQAEYFVIFGATAEFCIKRAVLALLARQRHMVVVQDACGYWCPSDADLAFRQMAAKGAILTTTEELLSGAIEARVEAHRRAKGADASPDCKGPTSFKDLVQDRSPAQPHDPATTTHDRKARPGRNGRSKREMADLVAQARRKLKAVAQRQAKSR